MISQKQSLSKAFSSQLLETTVENLCFEGLIPKWLNGYFINNGPGQFEIGNTHFNHWFDGFAMLKKFQFNDGNVCFQNRFLQSQQYLKSKELNQLNHDEFGTYVNGTWLKNLFQNLKTGKKSTQYDNCNVNTTRIGNNYVAMTESNEMIAFELNDLQTLGPVRYQDNVQGQVSLAHPHLDIYTGEVINISMEIGKTCQYHVFTIKPGTMRREIIKTIECDHFFYMHSFCVTKNYIILFKTPLRINKWKVMLGLTICQSFAWQKGIPSFFVLINRNTGEISEIETDSFVCLHSINSFEKGNELIIDLVCYDKGKPYDTFYLENLKAEKPKYMSTITKRFVINTQLKRCQEETLNENCVEFPRINYKLKNGNDYQYVYSALMTNISEPFLNAIQKLDIHSGEVKIWENQGYYPGEPVFIPKTNCEAEDDGVLMFIAFSELSQLSSLFILDAQTMQQMAEVFLPFHLPIGLHSNFYQSL